MTKTTNFEISKKLAEIGFRDKCDYFYFHEDKNDYEASSLEAFGWDEISDCDIEDKYYPSYDLETLLDALPKEIPHKNHKKLFGMLVNLTINFISKKDIVNIGYSFGCFDFIETKKGNESLADTAGRLIIWLHEKNLIEF